MADIHHTTRRGCVLTARDLTMIKRKFDRTCEELGVYAEDDRARHALGRALLAAVARGETELLADEAPDAAGTETLFFEGEELVVALTERAGH
ncbi:hypothetical protein [Phreatobacter sp.]|uniref:hypothetical protein n=1 Tax=Phreatobacter sp. TaxID=1966341 RepID=UPI0025D48616|nr:hypothetical protein [Phreatobacter sp.]